jgi:hypothetical protein
MPEQSGRCNMEHHLARCLQLYRRRFLLQLEDMWMLYLCICNRWMPQLHIKCYECCVPILLDCSELCVEFGDWYLRL